MSTPAAQTAAAVPVERAAFLQQRHGAANIALVLRAHAALLAWFWVGWHALPLVVYVPLTLVACVVHQRAMSEWIHEAAHFNLLADRRWNDILGDMLAGIWFALPIASYRATHFQHHARSAFFLPGDPDTVFLLVRSRREVRRGMLRDVSGLTVAAQYLRFGGSSRRPPAGPRFLAVFAASQLALLAMLWWIGRLDAWVLYYGSLATLYPLMNRLRTYGQHAELGGQACTLESSTTSRTMNTGLAGTMLMASARLLYHYEHHRWPSLPWRALRSICVADQDVNRYATSYALLFRRLYRSLPES
jgi:fatty acid desaturase